MSGSRPLPSNSLDQQFRTTMFDAATPEDSRPVKRTRVDSTRIPDRFDFVSQPAYGSNAPPQSTAEANTRKAHGKKQPLSCAECRRLKLKVSWSFQPGCLVLDAHSLSAIVVSPAVAARSEAALKYALTVRSHITPDVEH